MTRSHLDTVPVGTQYAVKSQAKRHLPCRAPPGFPLSVQ